jgi:phosphatidate cytidylyltransferase
VNFLKSPEEIAYALSSRHVARFYLIAIFAAVKKDESLKEFYTRALTGAVFAVLVLGSIVWSPWAFFVLMGIFVALALIEFVKLFPSNPKPQGTIIYYFLGLAIYAIVGLTGMNILDFSNLLLVVLSFYVLMAVELFRQPKPSWMQIAAGFSAFIFIAVPFGLMNSLFWLGNGNVSFPWILLALFVLVWVNDVFAYLVGTSIGKHKLYKKLSPKKTWEGSLGGFLFTMLCAWLFSLFAPTFDLTHWLWLGFIISVSGNLGDLIESLLKRNSGVKDAGTFFPGHGGVLDRFDAVLFATPFVFFYLYTL